MRKSPDAFRTISEVAAWLETPAHVLRFWESRFADLKPVQRAGGRRYYRPQDMLLLGGIKHLLHTEGHTIKSVQDRIRADGTDAVAAFSPPLTPVDMDADQTGEDSTPQHGLAIADALTVETETAAASTAVDRDAPPIGFFYDDSEDAAPAEAQSGTFAQPLATDPPAPEPETSSFADMSHALPDTGAAAPRLAALPPMADDPEDDASGFGKPLTLSARLRALAPDDIDEGHRTTLRGLFRRLDGRQRAHG